MYSKTLLSIITGMTIILAKTIANSAGKKEGGTSKERPPQVLLCLLALIPILPTDYTELVRFPLWWSF